MSQVNVNREPPVIVDGGSSDRSSAAGINMITVLIVLAVLVVLGWFLFTGPLQSVTQPGNTNINVNPPAVNVNPPAQQAPSVNVNPPAAPAAPAGNSGSSTNPAPATR